MKKESTYEIELLFKFFEKDLESLMFSFWIALDLGNYSEKFLEFNCPICTEI